MLNVRLIKNWMAKSQTEIQNDTQTLHPVNFSLIQDIRDVNNVKMILVLCYIDFYDKIGKYIVRLTS